MGVRQTLDAFQALPAKSIVVRLLMGFAALSLFTAFVLTLFGGDQILTKSVPARNTTLGPLKITEASTILDVKVTQALSLGAWSDVNITLEDAREKPLTGFGDEFWHQQGYDAEGYYWNQSKGRYRTRIVVDKPGTYYLGVSVDDNLARPRGSDNPITVRVARGGFSYIPHFAAGLIALIAAISPEPDTQRSDHERSAQAHVVAGARSTHAQILSDHAGAAGGRLYRPVLVQQQRLRLCRLRRLRLRPVVLVFRRPALLFDPQRAQRQPRRPGRVAAAAFNMANDAV